MVVQYLWYVIVQCTSVALSDIRPARPVRRCKQNIDVTNAPPVKLSTDTRTLLIIHTYKVLQFQFHVCMVTLSIHI